jgi:hypothetical protein
MKIVIALAILMAINLLPTIALESDTIEYAQKRCQLELARIRGRYTEEEVARNLNNWFNSNSRSTTIRFARPKAYTEIERIQSLEEIGYEYLSEADKIFYREYITAGTTGYTEAEAKLIQDSLIPQGEI